MQTVLHEQSFRHTNYTEGHTENGSRNIYVLTGVFKEIKENMEMLVGIALRQRDQFYFLASFRFPVLLMSSLGDGLS
jgi:hypothetical protein